MKPLDILPDAYGRYGQFGGRFVPETLVPALTQVEQAWREARVDSGFRSELDGLLETYVGRPTPLYKARRLSERLGATIWIKREDLCHTGSHKLNNVLGQVLLARRLGKSSIVAETGAGQHGVATATAAALFGMNCEVYMGATDVKRQALNVFRMELLGARVISVDSGSATLKDAINDAFRSWVATVESTHYVFGSAAGPHPYPWIVQELQSVIGHETREQILSVRGKLPDMVVACVGGGSNAIGMFSGFVGLGCDLVGIEAGGHGIASGQHAATMTAGGSGILHGAFSRVLQDGDGQIIEAHSISAGLDYPGVGPEHAYLQSEGLARYDCATDEEALTGFQELSRLEGIIPALEPAHAVGWLLRQAEAGTLPGGGDIVLMLSGRGDKDVDAVRERLSQ